MQRAHELTALELVDFENCSVYTQRVRMDFTRADIG
jgi:hypothetical protein